MGARKVLCRCDHCGQEFERYLSKVKRVKRVFCSPTCHDAARRARARKKCVVCGREWEAVGANTPRYRRKTCSRECWHKMAQQGLEAGWTRGGKGWRLTTQGYIEVRMPEHPRANKNGYVKRAILVMEKKLGRPLRKGEIVHHIDGNRTNDRPDNLMLFSSNADHVRFHYLRGDYGIQGAPTGAHARERGRREVWVGVLTAHDEATADVTTARAEAR